jgi:hypothetical protein
MRKKIILFVVLAGAIAIIAYSYLYQDHRDVAATKADYTIEASALSQAFINDEKQATTAYLNKIIEIKGIVKDIDSNVLTLDSNILVDLLETPTPQEANKLKGSPQNFKGRCIGYDNLLEEVRLDQATIL